MGLADSNPSSRRRDLREKVLVQLAGLHDLETDADDLFIDDLNLRIANARGEYESMLYILDHRPSDDVELEVELVDG